MQTTILIVTGCAVAPLLVVLAAIVAQSVLRRPPAWLCGIAGHRPELRTTGIYPVRMCRRCGQPTRTA